MNYYVVTYDNYLEHHGIMGQKWGVRRYQNPDGTLTPAGQSRLNKYKEKELNKIEKSYGGRIKERRMKQGQKIMDKHSKLIDEMRNNKVSREKFVKKSAMYEDRAAYLLRQSVYEVIEKNKVMNMSYNDMMSEKHKAKIDKGKYYAQTILLGSIGTSLFNKNLNTTLKKGYAGGYSGGIADRTSKFNNRVSERDSISADRSARIAYRKYMTAGISTSLKPEKLHGRKIE